MPYGEPNDQQGGVVYIFSRGPGGWTEEGWPVASDVDHGDTFGYCVAMDDDQVVCGAIVADIGTAVDAGAVHMFELGARTVGLYCMCDAGNCGNADPSAGCKTSDANGARLFRSTGSTSVAADDLVLSALQFPSNKSALLFMGGAPGSIPFCDGIRCIGASGGLYRFATQNTGASGTITEFGLVAHSATAFPQTGQISAGSTWNFQVWYRDPAGPCGQLTNVSNAVRVTFEP